MDKKIDTPIVSVIMPVYNCEKYIQEAVESILNQTYTNFELLIIDDCSTDKTVSIINNFKDPRIKLNVKEKNTGYTNSLNYGLTIAIGKYIARMDGDDISLPERFEKQVSFLEENQDVVLCGTAYKIMHNKRYITFPEKHDLIKVRMLKGNQIAHPSVVIRASILKEHHLEYNPKMEPAEDYDLWTRMLCLGKFHNLQEPLLNYRIHEKQVSTQFKNIQLANDIDIKLFLWHQLDYDRANFTDDFLTQMIFTKSFFNDVDFKLLLAWFNQIKKTNRKDTVYNPSELNKVINELLGGLIFDIYFTNHRTGIDKKHRTRIFKFLPLNFKFKILQAKLKEKFKVLLKK